MARDKLSMAELAKVVGGVTISGGASDPSQPLLPGGDITPLDQLDFGSLDPAGDIHDGSINHEPMALTVGAGAGSATLSVGSTPVLGTSGGTSGSETAPQPSDHVLSNPQGNPPPLGGNGFTPLGGNGFTPLGGNGFTPLNNTATAPTPVLGGSNPPPPVLGGGFTPLDKLDFGTVDPDGGIKAGDFNVEPTVLTVGSGAGMATATVNTSAPVLGTGGGSLSLNGTGTPGGEGTTVPAPSVLTNPLGGPLNGTPTINPAGGTLSPTPVAPGVLQPKS